MIEVILFRYLNINPKKLLLDRTLLFQLWSGGIYSIKRVQQKQQVIIVLHKQS